MHGHCRVNGGFWTGQINFIFLFGLIFMRLETVKSEGLAHNSYYLSSNGEAVVIDPRRDCEIYTKLAAEDCAQIRYILETHRNEDYVVGSLELQNITEAEIAHSKTLPFKYGELNLKDGDTLNVGGIKIKALHTPGHTNESLCYLTYMPSNSEPMMVFCGDTLFSGSVGRTDLYGKPAQAGQAEKLYFSLHEKLLCVGDGVLVYPGHGVGSVCGHGISGLDPTTVGYEKKTNLYLKLGKEEFIKKCLSDPLIVPKYFKSIEKYNLEGAPLLSELAYPKALTLSAFEEDMAEANVIVVDTRNPYAYAGSHIPNSLSIWLDGISVYPGWLLDIKQYIVFIHEKPEDIDKAAVRIRRLGFDNVCGFLCGGMNQWQQEGKPVSYTGTLSAVELKDKLAKDEVALLDVREPSERESDGYIKGAQRVFFVDLPQTLAELPKEKPLAVTCSVGNRASTAVSILERAGFKNLNNVLGGMTAWNKLGYPTKKEPL